MRAARSVSVRASRGPGHHPVQIANPEAEMVGVAGDPAGLLLAFVHASPVRTPRRRSSIAADRPDGPPPTIAT